jgi:hypothetical protein
MICVYFRDIPLKLKDVRAIEQWALTNIGVRDTSMYGWNWIGLSSTASGPIGIRVPDRQALLSFTLSFPFELYGEFETIEEVDYAQWHKNR